ncbi:PREDICTED: uncharacterized protein LOC108564592 [Nicrophorus vespilloides]|uniref:Uncharacterized protein LOC108564592 n=1 Tax=Nicrophorus vespilloides TaxID=110193 RepID=A0ABM1MX78_NICVS|nr:PREDICTED: uncharacterized protein LOC108564592 [Nicrophorus vespilloides]
MCLKKPLIPLHIQALVLDPDNRSVNPEVVAQDALGLIMQEVAGRQLRLVQHILDLLHHVLKYTPTDELAGCNVPISMMPVFFNLQAEHISQWRRVATIFVELIRYAPQQLNIQSNVEPTNNLIIQNLARDEHFGRANNFILQRLDDMSVVLRRYIARTDNRGDATCLEVYEHRIRTNIQAHRSNCI